MGRGAGAEGLRGAGARPWPPAAEAVGVELSTAGVLALLLVLYLTEMLLFSDRALRALGSVPWPFDPASAPVGRQLLIPSVLSTAVAFLVVVALGWRRASGLVRGGTSPWGVVSLAVLLVATALTVGIPEVSARGSAFLAFVALGLFFAALVEEIVFRGFLLHGLGRRLGGREAVLLGSALFASAHLPVLVRSRLPGPAIALNLVALFAFGVLLCRIRVATGSLWFATGAHTLWNFVTIGVAIRTYAPRDVPTGLALVKLAPILLGLGLAVRLSRMSNAPTPPMPIHAVEPLAAAAPMPAGAFAAAPGLPPPPPPHT